MGGRGVALPPPGGRPPRKKMIWIICIYDNQLYILLQQRMSHQSEKTLKFIEKARAKHGDKYDYPEVNYTGAKDKVRITCKTHGIFEQSPTNHLTGFGCNLCANNKRIDTAEFIKRAKAVHGDRYDYSKTVYVNTDTPLIVICAKHGEFTPRPDFHINRKTGCPKCNGGVQFCSNDFISKANEVHNFRYDYSKVNYVNNRAHVTIICKTHGEFSQIPYLHLHAVKKYGCPHCINKTEFKMRNILQSVYPNVIHQYKVDWCKNRQCLPYDFCIPDLKIIIELDGEQHFKQVSKWRSPDLQVKTDLFKMKCANDNGFSVIRVMHSLVFNSGTKDEIEKLRAYTEKKDITTWFNKLIEYVDIIKNTGQIHNYFICEGAKYNYDKHIQLLSQSEPINVSDIPDSNVIEIDADDLDIIDENDINEYVIPDGV